jgi:glycosyltransferase involved in cell wall biosynthesis
VKVLHLLRALRVGGLEEVVVNLVNGLSERGVECHVGCLVEEGPWRSRVRDQGLWVGRLEEQGRLRCVFSLASYLRRNRIELLHTHNSQAHLFGVAAHCLTGVPVVHTKHGQNWPDDPWWVWKSRQASRLTRKIVAVSADIERIVTGVESVPAAKVTTIRNGIDVQRFSLPNAERVAARQRSRAAAGIPEDAFVVGTVGRLAWEKNYELLVKAFSTFARGVPAAHMVLVGEGPYRERIQSAAVQANLESCCHLVGQQDQVADWLAAMDTFVLSSRTEGTSITLLESSASGVACIVTDVGGNAEIVSDGVTGLVVPPDNERALSRALVSLYGDAALRARLGWAAREKVATDYSVEKMVSQYMQLYSAVVERT